MSVTATTPEIVTLAEAQEYLRDLGVRDGNLDHLQRIINGVTGEAYEITARKRILDTDAEIQEYRDGDGTQMIYTDEFPITDVALVVRWPNDSTLIDVITGPGAATSNDDVVVDQAGGKIILRDKTFPIGAQKVLLTYKAGHATGSPEVESFRLVLLEQIQARWQRFIEKPGIISTREAADDRWTFKSDAEIRKAWLAALRPWRRFYW